MTGRRVRWSVMVGVAALSVVTMAGSAFLFAGILTVAVLHQRATGQWTFDAGILTQWASTAGALSQAWGKVLFVGFAIAFAVKVPLFPLHTWLPDAHTEAPTAGSVVLAGVMLKMGTYGFMRFAIPMFPRAAVWAAPSRSRHRACRVACSPW